MHMNAPSLWEACPKNACFQVDRASNKLISDWSCACFAYFPTKRGANDIAGVENSPYFLRSGSLSVSLYRLMTFLPP